MANETRLKRLLRTASTQIAEGDFDAADTLLSAIETEATEKDLGPLTALGLPRRLHATRLRLAKARGNALLKAGLQYHLVPPPDLIAPLFALDADARRERVNAAAQPIPKIVHQIWIGSAPPVTTDIWRDHATRHGWHYRLWQESDLSALGINGDATFAAMRARRDFPGAVDVARYHALQRHGGLYLDCDWVPVGDRPFEDFLPMSGLFALAEKTPRLTGVGSPFLNNSVIAAPPGHPVFAQLLNTLPEVLQRLPRGPAWWVTGPLVFTLAARGGPVVVGDAAIVGGTAQPGAQRADVVQAVDHLGKSGDPAFLYAWKPWENGPA